MNLKWRWLHRHRFRTVRLKHFTWIRTGGDVTTLLRRCECGAVRTENIEGYWTMDELTGKKR